MSEIKIKAGDTVMVPATVEEVAANVTTLIMPDPFDRTAFIDNEVISAWNTRAGEGEDKAKELATHVEAYLKRIIGDAWDHEWWLEGYIKENPEYEKLRAALDAITAPREDGE